MRRLIAISLFVLVASIGAYYYSLDEASATGGAFPYTKHGGNTTDGATPCAGGVNRGLHGDYGGDCTNATYYNTPEAGKYKSGECTHCHEPHASFGGSEPPPNLNPGPWSYLLMTKYGTSDANYAWLCWGCHEEMFNINNEGSPTGMGRFKFYQGRVVFQASSHYNPPTGQFSWPGTTGDPVQIWPRQNRFSLPAGNQGSCLNCHTPHGILEQAGSEFDTAAVPVTEHLKASNASVSVDRLIPRQLIAWEEALCEGCHKLGSPTLAPDIQTEINKNIRVETAFAGHLGTRYTIYGTGHPVDNTALAGRHSLGEPAPLETWYDADAGRWIDPVKHVECYDCHNPHAVKAPTIYSNSVPGAGDGNGGRVAGVKYVDISGFAQDPAPIGVRQPYIYEVCLKCHGGTYKQVFDTAAGTDDVFPDEIRDREGDRGHFSNKRKEFDPGSHHFMNYPAGDIGYNTAYHPVAAPGRNGSLVLCMQLQTAFGLSCTNDATAASELSSLTIQCTDCHNSEATAATRGPVSESNLRITDRTPASQLGSSTLGPHGSTNNRLLRASYKTVNSSSGTYSGTGYAANRANFELCFLCHEEARFIGAYTNFGSTGTASWCCGPGSSTGAGSWNGNLHRYHLSTTAVCHDCHHNVHSNVEAQNTIYGNGLGAELPPDSHDGLSDGYVDTHLLNFGPQATGATSAKPRWYFDGSYFRCNLTCHNRTMSLCFYQHNATSGTLVQWCA